MKAIRLKMAAGALALWLAGGHTVPAFAQQIDPALAGAVTAQTLELKSLHDKRRKTQEKIIAAEAAVTVALDRVKSVGSNLKGTAIAAIVSDELTDAATQMAALYPFMKQLVTSGSYDVTGADGKNEKHKVNLLDSSERYYIANEVVTRLETINTDLFILAWQVRTLSWNDLWFSLDPEGWANVMSGKNIIGGIVADWKRGFN